MDTSNEMCDRIEALMKREGMQVERVNWPEPDVDSVVEHEVDMDVVTDGWIWNVRVNVVRFATEGPYADTLNRKYHKHRKGK